MLTNNSKQSENPRGKYLKRRLTKKECFKTLTENGDDWMSDGNELQRSDGCSDWKCAPTDGCEPE